ncbi:MAG TPA: PorV/PorQ family protein [bacterium]|nr:PorV/PorQ family protein [bacterium]
MKPKSILVLFFLLAGGLRGGEWKTAKYAGEFMGSGVGARGLAMGGAFSVLVRDASSAFWNPAGFAFLDHVQVQGMHAERFAGIVNRDFVGIGIPVISNGSSLGISIYRLGVDNIPYTRLINPEYSLGELFTDEEGNLIQNLPYIYKTVGNAEWAFMMTYAKRVHERFHYGSTVRIIHKHVGDYTAWGLGFDAGIWWNPVSNLQCAFVLWDATTTWIVWNPGRKEKILPNMKIGAAYPFQISVFQFRPVLDIGANFENMGSAAQLSWGRAGFDLHAGLELLVHNRIALRAGIDRGHFATGAGLIISAFAVDYCFARHIDLGNSHYVSLSINWNKKMLLSW